MDSIEFREVADFKIAHQVCRAPGKGRQHKYRLQGSSELIVCCVGELSQSCILKSIRAHFGLRGLGARSCETCAVTQRLGAVRLWAGSSWKALPYVEFLAS